MTEKKKKNNYRNTIFRNIQNPEMQITERPKHKLKMYKNSNYRNTDYRYTKYRRIEMKIIEMQEYNYWIT